MRAIQCACKTIGMVVLMTGAVGAATYSETVLSTDGVVVYYRMNTELAEIGDPLINEASAGTLDGLWGFEDGNLDTLPLSGIDGPNPNGGFNGLEADNYGAFFGGNFADDNDDGTTSDNMPDQMDLGILDELDNEFATLAFFMKTDIDGNDGRLFTSAPSAAHTFRLIYGVSDFTGSGLGDASAIAVSTGPGYDDPISNQQTRGAVYGDDQWHHLVVVRNGDDARDVQFYYDGTDISAEMVDVGDSYGTTGDTARIGARRGTNNNGNGAYEGNLDEFAYWNRALSAAEATALYNAAVGADSPPLQAGDADMNLSFDQFDIILVQQGAKYLTGELATWGEGDWNGAPGGTPGSPPAGNGTFDQLDIVAALANGLYLQGPYAVLRPDGRADDAQASVGYNAGSGEVWVDAPAGVELTSINIDSVAGVFVGDPAENLGGSFDNDTDSNVFKATFGSSFGSLSFGYVAQPGLAEDFLLTDFTVVGSLDGGGSLGDVDLIYVPVPEPSACLLLTIGLMGITQSSRGRKR